MTLTPEAEISKLIWLFFSKKKTRCKWSCWGWGSCWTRGSLCLLKDTQCSQIEFNLFCHGIWWPDRQTLLVYFGIIFAGLRISFLWYTRKAKPTKRGLKLVSETDFSQSPFKVFPATTSDNSFSSWLKKGCRPWRRWSWIFGCLDW